MTLLATPVRRPVATAMFFTALVLLGLLAWWKIPVELFPPVSGDSLYLSFVRPGSPPEVVEREILMPLEARLGAVGDVEQTEGEIRGATGFLRVRFEKGTDIKVRELELRQLAAELAHSQPAGTTIDVSAANDFSAMSRFVMVAQVTAPVDRDTLRSLVEEEIEPRVSGVGGVSRVLVFGGSRQGIRVDLSPSRLAALGVAPEAVARRLAEVIAPPRSAGRIDGFGRRQIVLVDGRPKGVASLGEVLLVPGLPVRLRHVASIDRTGGRERTLFRVDGRNAVGLVVFKNESANLVRLGRDLRRRFESLRGEFAERGVGFSINFDAAEVVEKQIRRLEKLTVAGFVIALVALMLFLRRLRAVLVVALAVPASLLIALALLYLAGQSLNLITLFGLAVGLGMLVDNAIVVYEAIQRQLERGRDATAATLEGGRRTVRAILAATATNAIVFFPLVFVDFGDSAMQALVTILALAYLLPLAGSLIVALGLVPLLSRRLAAPAALGAIAAGRRRRAERGGLTPPDTGREVFTSLLAGALRRPGAWLAGIAGAVLITAVVATVWLGVNTVSGSTRESDEVRLSLRLPAGTSLERGSATFEQVERELLGTAGVASVSSFIEEGSGSLTIRLEDPEQRPPETTAASLRARVERLVEQDLPGTRVFRPGEDQAGGGGGTEQTAGLLGAGPARVRLSGPDAERLLALGRQLAARLGALEEVDAAWVAGGGNLAELRVEPRRELLTALGLPVESILPALSAFRREGVALPVGMVGQDGKQIPVTVFRQGAKLDRRALERIPLSTPAGSTTLGVISDFRVQRAAPVIRHRNGRREVSVLYRLSSELPEVGPRRVEIERQLRATVRSLALPRGYTLETETRQAATSWFKKILVPVLLLLFAVLAVTFESFSLPVLVLLALPLTLVGAAWSLIAAGMPADLMALVGTLALLGLTVNPAILLVDRMQQRTRSGVWGPGAAALAAVRERARPVLMTTVTTLAGLWPLALATGQENEIWPPFATVVMGGLAASTVLTLVVIPLAYVLLRRLDMLFGRLGPWVVLIWLGLTTVVVAPLFKGGAVTSLTWQIVTTVLVATGWLLAIALIWRREPPPEPLSEAGAPPRLEVRALTKLYGLPGPLRAALGAEREFLERVRARGARAWLPGDAVEPLARYALLAGGAGYLAYASSGGVWKILFLFVTAGLLGQWLRQVRRWRGKVDDIGRQTPGGLEGALAFALPWVAWEVVLFRDTLSAWFEGRAELGWRLAGTLLLAGVIALTQYARHLARHDPRGSEREGGRWYGRAALRRLARRWLLPGVQAEVVRALDHAEFDAERGMIGILGPNGAGKTTLLRLLAGILDPVTGVVRLGGQPLEGLRRRLAHWLGYLPQDFGLPGNMTGREYLLYFALLYEITPAGLRRERVDRLLEEVGLGEKADQRIADYSGGMRQRVAIARTLLRLPPVIIVDEPTVGLDPRERIRFRNLLARLARGRIVLFSTHVVEDVEVSCERVLVLSGGRLVYDGSPQGLARRAAGRVWELKLSGDRAPKLPEQARVVDETPLGDGSRRLRVLSDVAPGEQASPAEPSLEDGYMLLVRGTA